MLNQYWNYLKLRMAQLRDEEEGQDLIEYTLLLAFVALVPNLIHKIPLAALSAMLVYTGFRLASPREFVHVYHIGREQFIIFVATMIGVLATDLLVGVFIGIGVKFGIHILNGVPIRSLFKPYLEVEEMDSNTYIIKAHQSAVFSNWIPFKREIEDIGLVQRKNLIVDLSDTMLVDHSVMDKLHEMESDFEQQGLSFRVVGLDAHRPFADHAQAARRKGLCLVQRLTVVVDPGIERMLESRFLKLGASGFTSIPCRGVGRHDRHLELLRCQATTHGRVAGPGDALLDAHHCRQR